MPVVGDVLCNELEEEIVSMNASAMFGLPGKEDLRNGPPEIRKPRTMGIGWLIYGFIRAARPQTVVEIGTGGSTACILWGLFHNEKGHLHTCDVFASGDTDETHGPNPLTEPDGSFMNHNKAASIRMVRKWGMDDIVTIHHESSKDFVPKWKGPIDMIVVDGDHHSDFIENDMKLLNYIRPGGYALFHDFLACMYEVGALLRDFVAKSDEWSLMVEPNCLSMGILQRKFYCDPKYMSVAGRLTQGDNPNAAKTPFQFTDPRACNCIQPWNGEWFPRTGEEWHSHQKEGHEIAEKIMAWEKEHGTVLEDMSEVNR